MGVEQRPSLCTHSPSSSLVHPHLALIAATRNHSSCCNTLTLQRFVERRVRFKFGTSDPGMISKECGCIESGSKCSASHIRTLSLQCCRSGL